MKPLKPWLSPTDQLQLLQERGMRVDNPEAALNYLNRLGYYRLSGYWYPMRRIDQAASAEQNRAVRENRFVAGSHFDEGYLPQLQLGSEVQDFA